MFLFTGISHFSTMKYDFAAMIPAPLPNDLWVIYLTGVLEIAGAIGLLIPQTRKLAGVCLAVYLELPPIGWQLFILNSAQSDFKVVPSLLDTYSTHLLAEALSC